MSRLDVLFWVVLPYAAITVFVLGHVWRYRNRQIEWTTRSTQLLESRRLRAGIILFHFGLLAVIGGHVMGILVPASVTERFGISEDMYHWVAVAGGLTSGTVLTVGFVLLMLRRDTNPRVRTTTVRIDRIAYGLLAVMIVTGMWGTVVEQLILHGPSYRHTVSPYFRGLFLLDPNVALISASAWVYKIHITVGWVLYMVWPFSRLVHAWSIPVSYLTRSNILYRSDRPAAPAAARKVAS